MKYALQGHDRDNGVQEMLISLLPDESHDKVEELSGEGCLSRAWEENGDICARADIWRGEKHHSAVVESPIPAETDGEEYKRVLTYNVKFAVYQAMLPLLDKRPAWGSMTGVKPAKPARLAIREGMDLAELDAWLDTHYDVTENRRKLCIRAAEYSLRAEDSLLPREIQLYIGIPFCPAKCSYCSFVSNDMTRWGHMVQPYVDSLLQEVEAAGKLLKAHNIPLGSIYIGGGTPTTLNEQQLEALPFAQIAQLAGKYEHPGYGLCTVTVEEGKAFLQYGVMRYELRQGENQLIGYWKSPLVPEDYDVITLKQDGEDLLLNAGENTLWLPFKKQA